MTKNDASDRTQTPIFVVSSGRTGSTFLARMINRHPRLVCISDLFEPVGEVPYFDQSRRVSGEEFFQILSEPSFPQRIEYWREQPNAELLYLHEKDEMVSLLLSYTLPFLAQDSPMTLFAEVEEMTRAFPRRTLADQLIALFDWLRDRHRGDLWVERTGGSLPHVADIVETWPEAKIVFNYRDSRETAISMMTGSFFRLYLELVENPDLEEWDWSYTPPIEEMGAMLDRWVMDAAPVFDALPDERKQRLSYEQLMTSPVEHLLRFVTFVRELPEPTAEDVAWAEAEARRIRPAPLRFPQLDPEEQQRLEAAVAPSLRYLGYD